MKTAEEKDPPVATTKAVPFHRRISRHRASGSRFSAANNARLPRSAMLLAIPVFCGLKGRFAEVCFGFVPQKGQGLVAGTTLRICGTVRPTNGVKRQV